MFARKTSASDAVIISVPCNVQGYIIQSADGAIDGAIIIKDDTTTFTHHGAGEPPGSYNCFGAKFSTSVKISMASANDKVTVVYLPI